MNFGQMMLVIMAVVLFTTVIMGLQRRMVSQIVMATNNVYNTQALKVSDYIFQRFEADLISGQIDFAEFRTRWTTAEQRGAALNPNTFNVLAGGENPRAFQLMNVDYFPRVRVVPTANPNIVNVEVRLEVHIPGQEPRFIGTLDAPFTKPFSNLNL